MGSHEARAVDRIILGPTLLTYWLAAGLHASIMRVDCPKREKRYKLTLNSQISPDKSMAAFLHRTHK